MCDAQSLPTLQLPRPYSAGKAWQYDPKEDQEQQQIMVIESSWMVAKSGIAPGIRGNKVWGTCSQASRRKTRPLIPRRRTSKARPGERMGWVSDIRTRHTQDNRKQTYETEIGRFRLPFLLATSATSSSLSLTPSTSSPLVILWPPPSPPAVSSGLLGAPSSCILTLTVDAGDETPLSPPTMGGSGEAIVDGSGDMGGQVLVCRVGGV